MSKKLVTIMLVLCVSFGLFVAGCETSTQHSGGSSSTTGSWDDGGGVYNGGNYSIPPGASLPELPSFSSYNNTPLYYFPTQTNKNSAGFTDPRTGDFVPPVVIMYTASVNADNPLHSVPVWLNNGLDGMVFRHDDTHIMGVIQTNNFAWNNTKLLGLNNVSQISVTLPAVAHNESGIPVDTRPVYTTNTGRTLTYKIRCSSLNQREGPVIQGPGGSRVTVPYPRLDRSSLSKIVPGLTTQTEAEAILGKAYEANTDVKSDGSKVCRYFFYETFPGGFYLPMVEVLYGNGKVISIETK